MLRAEIASILLAPGKRRFLSEIFFLDVWFHFAVLFLQGSKKEYNAMMEALGELEQAALTAVLLVGEGAYGMLVHERMQSLLGRKMSLGAVSTVLDRLENKGMVSSTYGDPTPERGGRPKRFFQVEAVGQRALEASLRRSAALALALEAM